MRKQRGFIALPMMAWGAIAAGALILALGVAVKVQSSRLEAVKQEFTGFKTQVKALGELAAAKAKAENDRQAKLLKETEVSSAKLSADLSIANKRLRDNRAALSRVPKAPEGSKRPDLACFDRTLLQSALQRFDEGASGLFNESDQSALRLKLSHDWAQGALAPSQ